MYRSYRNSNNSNNNDNNDDNNDDYNNDDNNDDNNSNNYNLNSEYNMDGGKRRTRKNNSTMMGGAKIPAVGTKAQVYHGTAKHTSGGLKKKDLMKTKRGRIVSRAKHALGKKALKNLRKAGYVAKKGTFKLFKK
jgi:hypothetical protein